MDLLAIAAADPTVIPLWAAFLFAFGMYPVGMFFGCNSCCDPCVCSSGRLPETITVTLDGFTDYSKKQLCTLSFSACYGSGGSGTVDEPGHSSPESDPVDDRGPITAVTLTDGGSGYAKLGRAAPTLSASVYTDTGSGASLEATVTKATQPDECGLDYWEVTAITVVSGGEGYIPSDFMLFGVAEGDSVEVSATANITIGRIEPTITLAIDSPSGSGADISAVLEEAPGAPPLAKTWLIDSVTIEDGGDNYTHLDAVVITLAEGSEQGSSASLALVTDNAEPTLSASVISTGGDGASLSVTLTEGVSSPSGSAVWAVTSIAVDTPGAAYAEGDSVPIDIVDGDARSGGCLAFVTEVDGSGGIVAVTIYEGGEYFKGGPITGVQVDYGGEYWKLDGTILAVELTNGGKYYREDASLPPYVAAVTVNISQGYNTPSDGAGAVITATVEDDPQSPDFGVITGLEIEDGGDGYLAWMWETNDCCGHYLNGQSIVLERFKDSNAAACEAATKDFYGQYNIPFAVDGQYYSVPSYCVYTTQFCGGWTVPFLLGPVWFKQPTNSKLQLYVGYRGEGERPVVKLGPPCYGGLGSGANSPGCYQDWIADEPIESCSQFSFTATPSGRPSISVTSGGQYEPDWRFSGCSENNNGVCQSCNVCCQGDGESPDEIEVEITDEWTTNRPAGLPDFSGTYVAPGTGNYWSFAALQTQSGLDTIGFGVGLYPCHSGLLPIYVAPLRENCETCIKQCRVWFGGINMSWTHNNILNVRRIAPEQLPNDCDDCESTPVCSPSGKTFALSIADPALVGYGNGTHVATATIQ